MCAFEVPDDGSRLAACLDRTMVFTVGYGVCRSIAVVDRSEELCSAYSVVDGCIHVSAGEPTRIDVHAIQTRCYCEEMIEKCIQW